MANTKRMSHIVHQDSLPPPLQNLGGGKGHNFKDYSGQEINSIKILYPVDRLQDGHITYLMQCYCGNYFINRPLAIKNNKTASCGCYKKNNTISRNHQKTLDIIGKQFGQLQVLEFSEYKTNK